MRIVFISIFVIFTLSSYAQTVIGIKGFKYFLSEEMPPQLDNSIGGELILAVSLSENRRFVARGGVAYINHKIRFNPIPNYILEFTPYNITIFPNTLTHKKFAETQIALGVDFNFVNMARYHAFIGVDVLTGVYDTEYESSNQRMKKSSMETGAVLGFRARAGTSYLIKNWLEPFIEASYYGKRYYGLADYKAMDIGIGFKFWINEKY